MLKWILRAIVVALIGYVGYGFYDYYRAGLHARPDMPDGAFSISYKNGLRAIITGIGEKDEGRRYFGFPQDVPHYIRDAWSICAPPEGDEVAMAEKFLEDRSMPGERFEVVCKVTVDDDVVVRGVITSVPRV